MDERKLVGVIVGLECGFMHQPADSKMRHHKPIEFLANEIGGLAAQHYLGSAQVGFEFVQGGFDFPALMIKRRQLARRGFVMIENGGDNPI